MNRWVSLMLALLIALGAGCRGVGGAQSVSGAAPAPREPESASGQGEASYQPPRAEAPAPFREESSQPESSPESRPLPHGESPAPSQESLTASTAALASEEESPDPPPAPPPPASAAADPGTSLRPPPFTPGGSYISSTLEGTGEIDAVAFEEELFRLINQARVRAGTSPLELNDTIRWAARIRAPEVLIRLSHTRPDGGAYYTALDEVGFAYAGKWHGENVSSMQFSRGMHDAESAAAIMFAELSKSSGHSANMLAGHFTRVGIGVYVLAEGDLVRVGSSQVFAGD